MLSRVLFGDRLDFEQKNGFTQMFLNNVYVDKIPQSTNIERDIGILITRSYAE